MNVGVLSSPRRGDLGGRRGGILGGGPSHPSGESADTMGERGMEPRASVTVVVGQFEDLVARGLRALIEDDSNIDIVRAEVSHDRIPPTIAELDPRVAILNFGSLRSPVDVHELQLAYPQTRLIVLANHPSPAECNQMLAFGATPTCRRRRATSSARSTSPRAGCTSCQRPRASSASTSR